MAAVLIGRLRSAMMPSTIAARSLSSSPSRQRDIKKIKVIKKSEDNATSGLCLTFTDDTQGFLSAELLRVLANDFFPTSSASKRVVWGKENVHIVGAEQCGSYALRLSFSDGYDSTMFPFTMMEEAERSKRKLMRQYMVSLSEKGLSRRPKLKRTPNQK
uniref:Gamma-butyrobetaine hydroxylase-like N-terminal domain-containing protein n=1 Tax=Palpitomonas bilix TaxID=652834 RepID=A0A7S3DHK8_9EUKA|mmetsp:Transcript_37791/g.97509  ORF Transcript_37791/g.97509 Transcript_37791/m.97509 type:complete len:159 (+) Transcript_37791:215-691(+)